MSQTAAFVAALLPAQAMTSYVGGIEGASNLSQNLGSNVKSTETEAWSKSR